MDEFPRILDIAGPAGDRQPYVLMRLKVRVRQGEGQTSTSKRELLYLYLIRLCREMVGENNSDIIWVVNGWKESQLYESFEL